MHRISLWIVTAAAAVAGFEVGGRGIGESGGREAAWAAARAVAGATTGAAAGTTARTTAGAATWAVPRATAEEATTATAARLGPPTICFPIEIGDAATLPLGDNHLTVKYGCYERVPGDAKKRESVRFIEDTLAFLKPETAPLVRMETLRRATYYAHGMQPGKGAVPVGSADRLLAEVLARALDAETSADPGRKRAAWLDAAWLRACYADLGEHASVQAYEWLKRALELGGKEQAEFEFAAAVLTMHAQALGRDAIAPFHADHVKRAARAATEDSLVAKNLLSRFGGEGATLKSLRGE